MVRWLTSELERKLPYISSFDHSPFAIYPFIRPETSLVAFQVITFQRVPFLVEYLMHARKVNSTKVRGE